MAKHYPNSIEQVAFENVTFNTDTGLTLLNEVTLDLTGLRYVLVNGAMSSGKTLLLKLVAGLQMPNSGSVLFNGEPTREMSFEEFLPYRMNIGFSFEMGGLINNKTLKENLMLPAQYHPSFIDFNPSERVEELMALFGVERYKNLRPSAMPGGIRKMAVVMRAMIMHPEFIILDDPTTGLRRTQKNILKDYLLKKKLSKKMKHLLIVSEDKEFLRDLVEHELFIENGKVKAIELHQAKVVGA